MNNDQVTLKDVCIKFISLVENKKGYWKVALILIILLSIICYFLPAPWRRYWYEDNGHFPWVGISAFIAAIGFIGNQIWEHRKLNADVKSKTEINRINLMRDLLANYLTDSERFDGTITEVLETEKCELSKSLNGEDGEKLRKRFNDQRNNELIGYRRLSLYDIGDSVKLMEKINNMHKSLEEKAESAGKLLNGKSEDSQYKDGNDIQKDIERAICLGRDYFEKNFKKAEKGE